MLCYAMLCYAMLCYAMLCYAMLCYAMLCYAMLCYAISNFYFSDSYPLETSGGPFRHARELQNRKHTYSNLSTRMYPSVGPYIYS